MTARQTSYLTSLTGERTETLRRIAEGTDRTAAAKARFLLGNRVSELNVREASEAIEWLLTLPRDDAGQPRIPEADVPAGRYAAPGEDGALRFYRVDRPTEGRWAGRTFVNVQASDEWHPVRHQASRAAILAKIAADPQGAMKLYGQEIGRCGRCGRTLTDETSRAMGIGPECADLLGIDRTPYTERARRERVAATIAVHEEPETPQTATATLPAPGSHDPDACDRCHQGGRELYHYESADEASEYDGMSICDPCNSALVTEEHQRGAARTPAPTTSLSAAISSRVTAPAPRLTWQERAEAVREQQAADATPRRTYDSVMRQAAAAIEGKQAPFTLYVIDQGQDAKTRKFDSGIEAYLAAKHAWQSGPLSRRVTLMDSTSDLVVEWDF